MNSTSKFQNFTSFNIQSTANYLKLNKCVYITVLLIISVFSKCLMDKEASKVFTSHSKCIYRPAQCHVGQGSMEELCQCSPGGNKPDMMMMSILKLSLLIYRQRDPPGQKCVYLLSEAQSQNFYAIYPQPFMSKPSLKSLPVKKYSKTFTCLTNPEDLFESSNMPVYSIDLTCKQMKDDQIFSLSMSYEVQHGYYNASLPNLSPDEIERFLSSSTLQRYLLKAPNINRDYFCLKPSSSKEQIEMRETRKQTIKIIMTSPFVENVPEVRLEERHRRQAAVQRNTSRASQVLPIASLLVRDLSAQSKSERNDFKTELISTDLQQTTKPGIFPTETRIFEALDEETVIF